VARLTKDNVARAMEIIGRYPDPRSAVLPLLYLAQEQEGHVTEEAMEHIAELLKLSPAEVLGTCSFYTMFKLHPVGRYVISICTNIACMLDGGYELLEHAERSLGVKPEGTTADGAFTLEEAECLAACDGAPCLTVNYRFFEKVTPEAFDRLCDDLRAGHLDDLVPRHGVMIRPQAPAATAAVPSTRQPTPQGHEGATPFGHGGGPFGDEDRTDRPAPAAPYRHGTR
jgi:NADH-quinone oxidoreductase subunit E